MTEMLMLGVGFVVGVVTVVAVRPKERDAMARLRARLEALERARR